MTRTLRLVPNRPEVQYRRHRRPLAERMAEAGDALAAIEDAADWREFELMVWGDGRLQPMPIRHRDIKPSNVIPIRQRSSSAEIAAVRILEERRGRR